MQCKKTLGLDAFINNTLYKQQQDKQHGGVDSFSAGSRKQQIVPPANPKVSMSSLTVSDGVGVQADLISDKLRGLLDKANPRRHVQTAPAGSLSKIVKTKLVLSLSSSLALMNLQA